MKLPARWLRVLTLAAILLAIVVPLTLVIPLGLDPLPLRDLATNLEEARQRQRDLDELDRTVQARHEAKRRVGLALASGEIDPVEAAARLCDIHNADPTFAW